MLQKQCLRLNIIKNFIHNSNVDQKLPLAQISETRFRKLKSSANRGKTLNCFESEFEQTLNRYCKTAGGIGGKPLRSNAVRKWIVSQSKRMAMTKLRKQYAGSCPGASKEQKRSRPNPCCWPRRDGAASNDGGSNDDKSICE